MAERVPWERSSFSRRINHDECTLLAAHEEALLCALHSRRKEPSKLLLPKNNELRAAMSTYFDSVSSKSDEKEFKFDDASNEVRDLATQLLPILRRVKDLKRMNELYHFSLMEILDAVECGAKMAEGKAGIRAKVISQLLYLVAPAMISQDEDALLWILAVRSWRNVVAKMECKGMLRTPRLLECKGMLRTPRLLYSTILSLLESVGACIPR